MAIRALITSFRSFPLMETAPPYLPRAHGQIHFRCISGITVPAVDRLTDQPKEKLQIPIRWRTGFVAFLKARS
jgi:hypothetical protein